MLKKRALPSILLAICVLASACGGGATHGGTRPTATQARGAGGRGHGHRTVRLTEMAAVVKPVKTRFAPTVTVAPGAVVVLKTKLPVTSAARVDVDLSVERASNSRWEVTASALGEKAVATLVAARGKPVSLASVSYVCVLPPRPSFCPAQSLASTSRSYRMRFSRTPRSGLAIAAIFGSSGSSPPAAPAPGKRAVGPYTVTEVVSSFPQGSGDCESEVLAGHQRCSGRIGGIEDTRRRGEWRRPTARRDQLWSGPNEEASCVRKRSWRPSLHRDGHERNGRAVYAVAALHMLSTARAQLLPGHSRHQLSPLHA